jgi:hypothetical protein
MAPHLSVRWTLLTDNIITPFPSERHHPASSNAQKLALTRTIQLHSRLEDFDDERTEANEG